MGNPAGERAKKKERRRKKHEQRLQIGRYAVSTDSKDDKTKGKTSSQSNE